MSPEGRRSRPSTERPGYSRRAPGPGPAHKRRLPPWGWLPAVIAVVLAVAAVFLVQAPSSGPEAWSRLGTQDVHSLAFAGDPSRLLFGHHGGISESRDGGRTWNPTAARDDAMSLAAASDGSIIIAGHEVFSASDDGGASWRPVATDLPSLDIHGFARDPADPARMWAALATGGLHESRDGGRTFSQVFAENVLFPVATSRDGATRLFAIAGSGLVMSEDGGRTFAPRTSPQLFPIATLAATPDGTTLVAGGPGGVYRSDDAGQSWRDLGFAPGAAALALSADGQVVAVVTRDTEFFRSDDGGATWPGP